MRFLLLVLLVLLSSCITQKRMERAASRVDLGQAYVKEGNEEAAIGTLREATKIDPRNWRGHNLLAMAYIAKGENDLAEASFQRALRINPGEAEILLNHGAWLVRTGKLDLAVADFQLALKDLDYRNPAMVQANLAYTLLLAGRHDEALGWVREAIRRAPTLCEAYYDLGLIQEARKDSLAALEAYDQLIKTCPQEAAGGMLRTGCVQVEVGMTEEGVASLKRVIEGTPGTAFADEARACLKTLGP